MSLSGKTTTIIIQRDVGNVPHTPLFPTLALVDLPLSNEGMTFRAEEGPRNSVLDRSRLHPLDGCRFVSLEES